MFSPDKSANQSNTLKIPSIDLVKQSTIRKVSSGYLERLQSIPSITIYLIFLLFLLKSLKSQHIMKKDMEKGGNLVYNPFENKYSQK